MEEKVGEVDQKIEHKIQIWNMRKKVSENLESSPGDQPSEWLEKIGGSH